MYMIIFDLIATNCISHAAKHAGICCTDLANVDSWVETGTDIHHNVCAKSLLRDRSSQNNL